MDSRLQEVGASGASLISSILRWLRQDFQRLIRVLVVSGVIIFCALILPMLPSRYLIFPLVFVVGVAGVILLLRWPPLGLAALLVGTLFISFEIGTGSSTGINVTVMLIVVMTGLWLVDMLVRQRRLQFVNSRPVYPLLALGIVSLLSFGVGQLPWFIYAKSAPITGQIAGLAIFLLSVAAFFLVANLVIDLKWLKRLTWLFLFLGAIYVSMGLFPTNWGAILISILPRGTGGSLLWIWLVALASSQALVNRNLSKAWRLALLVLVGGLFYVALVVSYDWKSGWIPPLFVVWLILFFRWPKLALVIALAGAAFFWKLPAQIIAGDQYSYDTRLIAWQIIWNGIVKVNPLLGLGPANYYYYTPLYNILGYNVQFNSHNNYLDIVAQIGLLGLGCFLWFVWETGRLGLQLRKEVDEGFEKAYLIGALAGLGGSLIAGMLGDWFIPFVYNVGVRGFRSSVLGWLFLAGIVVIEQVYLRRKISVND